MKGQEHVVVKNKNRIFHSFLMDCGLAIFLLMTSHYVTHGSQDT